MGFYEWINSYVLANANLFETSWYMRGFEQAFEDMLLQPDLTHFIQAGTPPENILAIFEEALNYYPFKPSF